MKLSDTSSRILRLAFPNILTNISVPLLSSVDTLLMGQFSAAHLGALGIGSMIFNFLYWNFGFLRMGTVGITAQAYGAKDNSAMIHTLARSILLGLVIAGILLLFQAPLRAGMTYLMQTSVDQKPMVWQYYNIRIWAAPATLALYGLFGFFFGMQNVITPLILTIVINVSNIIFSYLFIYQFGMEVAGVAWGTVLAQYIGLLAGGVFLARRYGYLFSALRQKVLLELAPLKAFFRINRDIFIRTFCLSSTFFFFYSESSNAGPIVLGANVVLLQFMNWMSFGVDGFAFATESLVGESKGAQREEDLHEIIRYAFYWGMGLAAVYSFIYGYWGSSLVQIFTNDPDVIQYAVKMLPWVIVLPILGTPSYIWDGVFVGLTASRAMRNTMIVAFIGFFTSYYLTQEWIGINSLWVALMLFLVIRGVGQGWLFWRHGGDV